jgi:hypothetical protein
VHLDLFNFFAMNRKHAVAAIGAISAAYLFFSLAWISLPGVQFDELLFVFAWYRHSPSEFFADQFRVFGGNIPTMMGPYLGTLKGWLWSVFFILGRSVYAVRIPAVLLGGVTLALFYRWVRRFYPRPTAVVALLLAATDSVYITTSRIDCGPVVLQRLLLMAGILAGTKWALEIKNVAGATAHTATPALRTPHSAFRIHSRLAAAGFCFGLGLWDKATFAWGLMALAATLLVLFPREVLRRLRPFSVAVFLLFFCLGALPVLDYNVRTTDRGTRAVTQWEQFDAQTWQRKWLDLRRGLGGEFMYSLMGGDSIDKGQAPRIYDTGQRLLDAVGWLAPEKATFFFWALGATILVGMAAAWYRQRAVLFPLLLSLTHLAAVLLTREAGGPHHTTLIYPFPHLAVAAAGAWLWQSATRLPVAGAWVVRRGLALALAAIVLTQLAYDARQLSAYRQVRGLRMWTDAIYDIASYVKANRTGLVVNMDWGFGTPLMFLTDDRVLVNDYYAQIAFLKADDETAQIKELLPLLARPNALFLFHTEPFSLFPSVRVFEQAVARSGRRAHVVCTFYQGTGQAVARLVRVDPSGEAGTGLPAALPKPLAPPDHTTATSSDPVPGRPGVALHMTEEGAVIWKADCNVMIFVQVDGGADKLMAYHPTGYVTPDFLMPGHTYRFTMKEAKNKGFVLGVLYWRKDRSGKLWLGRQPPGQQ